MQDPAERHHLWMAFGNALVTACPSCGDDVVRSMEADVVAVDEFSWWRAESSESLDLDHFSGPPPLRNPQV